MADFWQTVLQMPPQLQDGEEEAYVDFILSSA